MDKTLICIGGGELKTKETQKIDGYIAAKAKEHAAGNRAFLPRFSNTAGAMTAGLFFPQP